MTLKEKSIDYLSRKLCITLLLFISANLALYSGRITEKYWFYSLILGSLNYCFFSVWDNKKLSLKQIMDSISELRSSIDKKE